MTAPRREPVRPRRPVPPIPAPAPKGAKRGRSSVKPRHIVDFVLNLRAQLKVGIGVADALEEVAAQVEPDTARLADALRDAAWRVRQGASMADALEPHRETVDGPVVEFIRAGERQGTLVDRELPALKRMYRQKAALQSRFMTLLILPALVVVLSVVVTLILGMVLIPQLEPVFGSRESLPFATRLVLLVSDATRSFPAHLVFWSVLLASAVGFGMASRKPAFRERVDRFLLWLPKWRDIERREALASAFASLAASIGVGLPLIESIETAARVCSNRVIGRAIGRAAPIVEQGGTIAEAFDGQPDVFPPNARSFVRTGEKTGQLESMLGELADLYLEQAEELRKRFEQYLYYGMILLVGAYVALVVIALYLPMFKLVEAFTPHKGA